MSARRCGLRQRDIHYFGLKLSCTGDRTSAATKTVLLRQKAGEALAHLLESPLQSGLYLVATPIGNLGDISIRALSVLARSNIIYCENPHHSRKLLNHYAIRSEIGAYHEHNAGRVRPAIFARLAAGQSVALISDAGTPLISDPGYKLVRDAQAEGFRVHVVPGPSAPISALSVSGLPTDRFFFEGFLPAKQAQRRRRLNELSELPATLVLFETAQRLAASLADMAEILGNREAALVKELTKIHEAVERRALDALAGAFCGVDAKGEYVIVVAPPEEDDADDGEIRARLRPALAAKSLRDAVDEIADQLNVRRKRVYKLALEMQAEEKK